MYRAYDRAAVMFRGVDADINFNLSDYEDLKQVKKIMTDQFLFEYQFLCELIH